MELSTPLDGVLFNYWGQNIAAPGFACSNNFHIFYLITPNTNIPKHIKGVSQENNFMRRCYLVTNYNDKKANIFRQTIVLG